MSCEVAMKVECVHCGATGQMDETRIPPGVTSIKCPKCNQSFPIPPIPPIEVSSSVPDGVDSDAGVGTPSPRQPPPIPRTPVQPPPSSPPFSSSDMQSPQAATVATATCTVCAGQFPRNEMVRFGTAWVCADCKPGYVQMMAQGASRLGTMRYAGFNIRFGAKFLDGLILGAVSFVIRMLVGIPFYSPSPKTVMASTAMASVLQLGVAASYSGYFLSRHRATPGKMACGLMVVTPEGTSIGFWRGVGRYFSEFISSLILLIGYLMVLFDDEKRALHDRICNTRVIYK